ncbi:MAG: uncharacterized protein K0S45_1052 [Nitrospira sp.]|jgi:YHS domain-containing protein|nr:uncharacterized protein [Nitrospira sp.]
MYKILFIAALLILFYYLVKRAVGERGNGPAGKPGTSLHRNQMVQDPVCRVFIPRENAVREELGGQMYFFCSRNCANVFQKQLSG